MASYSRSADVTADLVDVGEGVQPSDYRNKEVAGRLVLASSPQEGGRMETVHRLAVLERGAAGVISYRGYERDDFPDLITWDHLWTLELGGKTSTFGFCLSKRMGRQLKRLLERGEKVVLRAAIDAEVLLFVRETKSLPSGLSAPYYFLGPCEYIAHEGNRPISIVWRLVHAVPARLFRIMARENVA